MFPDRVSQKEELRKAFLHIRNCVLPLAQGHKPKRAQLWKYEQLATLYGEERDWKHDGKIRNAMQGFEGRMLWLLADFNLWWKSDQTDHSGLLFTCHCKTGIDWLRRMAADRVERDGTLLLYASDRAMELNPTQRAYYRRIKTGGRRIKAGGDRLKEMGDDDDDVGLLGVTPNDGL